MKAKDWIKATDKLPEEEIDVLVYDDVQGILIAWLGGSGAWISHEYGVLEFVTH